MSVFKFPAFFCASSVIGTSIFARSEKIKVFGSQNLRFGGLVYLPEYRAATTLFLGAKLDLVDLLQQRTPSERWLSKISPDLFGSNLLFAAQSPLNLSFSANELMWQ